MEMGTGACEELKIIRFDELSSTNITAKEMAANGAKHGTVVIAKSQTAGKGTKSRTFFSPPGGIYMSIILRHAELPFSPPSLCTALAAVCVCEALEKHSDIMPEIKWINDILVNGKKVCGILAENDGVHKTVVLGIGINYNAAENDFPEELRGVAGSLYPNETPPVSRDEMAEDIAAYILSLPTAGDIIEKYKSRMYMLGTRVIVGEPYNITCTAVDVDEHGRLVVMMDDGSLRALV